MGIGVLTDIVRRARQMSLCARLAELTLTFLETVSCRIRHTPSANAVQPFQTCHEGIFQEFSDIALVQQGRLLPQSLATSILFLLLAPQTVCVVLHSPECLEAIGHAFSGGTVQVELRVWLEKDTAIVSTRPGFHEELKLLVDGKSAVDDIVDDIGIARVSDLSLELGSSLVNHLYELRVWSRYRGSHCDAQSRMSEYWSWLCS